MKHKNQSAVTGEGNAPCETAEQYRTRTFFYGEGKNDSETSLLSGAQAHRMLTEAKLPEAGIDRFCVLANDIFALANDEFDGDAISASRELQARIGGLQNLKSYTDCLLVGNRKFGL